MGLTRPKPAPKDRVFWDRPHNVTGRAPKSIELHPILDFACLS